jgi:hypothetical protein
MRKSYFVCQNVGRLLRFDVGNLGTVATICTLNLPGAFETLWEPGANKICQLVPVLRAFRESRQIWTAIAVGPTIVNA